LKHGVTTSVEENSGLVTAKYLWRAGSDPSRDPTLDLHEMYSRRPKIDPYIITVIIV
jgi:hypothetical protein